MQQTMTYYSELADYDGPSSFRAFFSQRSSLGRGSRSSSCGISEMSLQLDDIISATPSPRKPSSRMYSRRSSIEKSERGASEMSLQLDDIVIGGGRNGGGLGSTQPRMMFPRRDSTESFGRSKRSEYSETSLQLDDLCDPLGDSTRSTSRPLLGGVGGYPMPALDEEETWKERSSGGSYFFNFDDFNRGDHFQSSASEDTIDAQLRRLDDSTINRQAIAIAEMYADSRERTVKFSNNEPEVRCFPKATVEEMSLLYYGPNELQLIIDEYRAEERETRGCIIR